MTYEIVVGVDGSAASVAALRWSMDQAASRGGEVTALLAWQLPHISMPGAFDRDELAQAYQDLLVRTVRTVERALEVPVRTMLAEGDPARALVAAAREADALVLGIRSRTAPAGLPLGAVSQACGATAACPVVLIKGPDGPNLALAARVT
jgi:nucleotide-binding universal stress UspA family protein